MSTLRVPRLHGPLAAPRTISDVLARTLVLGRAHGPAFDDATPSQAVQAIFARWHLIGERRGQDDEDRHVFVLNRDTQWVGFGLFAETTRPTPPTSAHPDEMVDYLALMRTHRDSAAWHTLNGSQRLERLRVALTLNTLDRPIVADSAVQFLETAIGRAAGKVTRGRPNHVDYMGDIVIRQADAPDLDGTLAVARTMAGLGRYDSLAPVAQA